jgi:transposase InsO family protein
VAVVVDHVSRAVIGLAVFRGPPSAIEIQAAISEAIRRVGRPPKYIITDQGTQFRGGSWRRYCRDRAIRPRFGAVGKHGSIGIVERLIRAMKGECTTRMLVPLNLATMRHELGLYAAWYNEHRPSQALAGRTPREVYDGLRPANAKPRIESRRDWPRDSSCASPQTAVRGERGATVTVVISYVEGRRHLPVVELREAA